MNIGSNEGIQSYTYGWYLTICGGKGFSGVPPDIVVQIIVVALCPQLLGEWIISALLGISNICPGSQRAVNSDAVVVNLVTTTDHYVERDFGMPPHNIVPEARTAPIFLVGPH